MQTRRVTLSTNPVGTVKWKHRNNGSLKFTEVTEAQYRAQNWGTPPSGPYSFVSAALRYRVNETADGFPETGDFVVLLDGRVALTASRTSGENLFANAIVMVLQQGEYEVSPEGVLSTLVPLRDGTTITDGNWSGA